MKHGQNCELAHLRTESEKRPKRRACLHARVADLRRRTVHLGHLISTYRSDHAPDLGHVTAEGHEPSTCYPVPGARSTPHEEPSGQARVGCFAAKLQQPPARGRSCRKGEGFRLSRSGIALALLLSSVVRNRLASAATSVWHQACRRLRPRITV